MLRVKSTLLASAVLVVGASFLAPTQAEQIKTAFDEKSPPAYEEGKEIAFDRTKGNCLACHMIEGGASPGTIGPPLVAMKVRFPDKAKLRAQIYDPTVANPNSVMPPFGKHGALTPEELDKVVEFIHPL